MRLTILFLILIMCNLSCNYKINRVKIETPKVSKSLISYEYRFDYNKGDSIFAKEANIEYIKLLDTIKSCSLDTFSSIYLELYFYPYFWKEEIISERNLVYLRFKNVSNMIQDKVRQEYPNIGLIPCYLAYDYRNKGNEGEFSKDVYFSSGFLVYLRIRHI